MSSQENFVMLPLTGQLESLDSQTIKRRVEKPVVPANFFYLSEPLSPSL